MDIKEVTNLIVGEFRERELPELVLRDMRVPEVTGKVIAVIGMRRAGKTYFLFQKIQELLSRGIPLSRILYINFEDDRLLPVDQKKLAAMLDSFYALHPENHRQQVHVFLDEIQNVEGWPLVLRRFLNTRKVQFFITGSSAKLLSKEIATSLRGRSIACEIWPYSFPEWLRSLGKALPREPVGPAARDQFKGDFSEYLMNGGFPETVKMLANDRLVVLQGYVNAVLLNDIIERHHITNLPLIRYLIKTLVCGAGRSFSVNKFYNDLKSQGLKVGKNTLHEYLGFIEDAFLCFLIPIYADSPRKRQVNPRKIYAVDPGLVQAFCLGARRSLGNLFENVVYLELRRRGCELHYYWTRSGAEIDFIARDPTGEEQIFQVALEVAGTTTIEREQQALKEAEEETGLSGQLVTMENFISIFFASEASAPPPPS